MKVVDEAGDGQRGRGSVDPFAVLDAQVDEVVVLDRNGMILWVNRAWRHFGELNDAPAEVLEAIGQDYLAACVESSDLRSPTSTRSGIAAVLSGEASSYATEYPCHSTQGERWFLTTVTPVATAAGGAVIVHHDITERRTAQDLFRESEKNLAITLHSIGVAVITTDVRDCVSQMNPTAERMTDWTLDEAQGRPLAEVVFIVNSVTGEIVASPVELVRRAGATGGLANHTVLISRNGREHQITDSATPLHDADGSMIGVALVFSDVTDDHLVRAQLERTSAALERTSRIAHISGWEIGVRTVGYWLPQMFEILELEPPDRPPVADVIAMCADEASRTRLSEALEMATSSGTPWDLELPMITGRGRRIWVRSQGTPEYDGDVVDRVCGTLQDITGFKLLQLELSRTTRLDAIGRLAGGIAHDFNNVLSVILGRVELAMASVDPDSDVMTDLAEISAAAQRSAELTSQLLTFARQQAVEPVVLDLNQRIDGVLTLVQRLIGDTVTITWEPATDLWSVRSDPSQVDQILTNLGVNARDAIGSRPNGKVVISTSNVAIDRSYTEQHPDARPGEYVRITVTDNGSGIDDEQLDQIFDPFFTTKGFGVNSGLGLATVMGAVRQNDGFVTVTSQVGQGSRFEVHLPRHSVAAGVSPVTEPTLREPGHGTVLVVDDDPSVLAVLVEALSRSGYTVIRATDASAAIRIVESPPGPIDLMITDVSMPGMNGFDLATEVAKINPTIRRLFISGYHDDLKRRLDTLEDHHYHHYLHKPFTLDGLLAAVQAALTETD